MPVDAAALLLIVTLHQELRGFARLSQVMEHTGLEKDDALEALNHLMDREHVGCFKGPVFVNNEFMRRKSHKDGMYELTFEANVMVHITEEGKRYVENGCKARTD